MCGAVTDRCQLVLWPVLLFTFVVTLLLSPWLIYWNANEKELAAYWKQEEHNRLLNVYSQWKRLQKRKDRCKAFNNIVMLPTLAFRTIDLLMYRILSTLLFVMLWCIHVNVLLLLLLSTESSDWNCYLKRPSWRRQHIDNNQPYQFKNSYTFDSVQSLYCNLYADDHKEPTQVFRTFAFWLQ